MFQFTEFITEARSDEVLVLAGGLTVSKSHLVARLSGNLTASLPTYTSSNNFMMVIFSTDDTMGSRGFRAQFSAGENNMLNCRGVVSNWISKFCLQHKVSQDELSTCENTIYSFCD